MVKNLSTVDRSEKVRIGKYMPNDQALNSIVLNATSNVIEAPNSGLYVAPIRKGGSAISNALAYNSETHEIFDTGLTPETTLQGVMAFGNTTTLTAEFNNVATGLVTVANVGIANANPIHTLDIGSNVSIDDSGSNVLDVRGNVFVTQSTFITGNLHVLGDTTLVSKQNLIVDDGIVEIGKNNYDSLTATDLGFIMTRSPTEANVALGFRETDDVFILAHTQSSADGDNLVPDTSNSISMRVYGNVVADSFAGDGGLLSNIASNLEQIVNNGNVSSNTIQLTNVTDGLVATGNVTASYFKGDGTHVTNVLHMNEFDIHAANIRDEMATNTVTMYSNLASNLATIRSEMVANTVTVRSDLQSNVGIIRGEMAANTVTLRSEMAANTVAMQSNLNSNVSRIATLESEGLSHIVDRNNVSSNTIRLTNATDGLVATGNVTAAFFKGDGSKLTGLVTNLQDVSDNGNVTDNTLRLTNATDGLVATGNVTAAFFKGDGSKLTGLVTDLESVIINGNTTSNVVEFHGPLVSIVTSNAVGVKNTNPQHDFSVGTNVFVDDVASNILTVDGNILAHAITLDSVNLSAGMGLEKVIMLGNATSNVVEFNNATGFVTSSNVGIANASATHTMDIGSNVFIDDVGSNVLYVRGNIYSDIVTTPKLGVSNNAPTKDLSVGSNLHVDEYGSNVLVIGGNVSMGTKLSLGSVDLSVGQTLDNVVNMSNVTDNVIQLTNVTDGLVATGNVTAAYFKGIGSELTGLSSTLQQVSDNSNVTDNTLRLTNATDGLVATGNVTAAYFKGIGTELTGVALNTDITSIRSEMAANTVAMQSNLTDNSSRITALESSPMSIAGVKTFTSDVILEANLKVNGDLTYSNTVNLIVSDPIMELGANNQHSGDLGIVMVRHGGSESNVSMSYDEDDDILRFGYTDDSAHGTTIANTSDKLDVSITGNVAAAYDTNTTSYFGRAAVGYMGQSDQASFSHIDKNTSANFALKQAASGATHINTPTGQHIRFSVNASEVGRFSGGGDFKVGNNPVKFYVDTALSEVQMYSQATGSAAGPDLVLKRHNPNNGGNNEYIGQIRYEGFSSTGASRLYAKTTGKINTATDGSEDGIIETMIKTGGSNRISVRHSGAKFLITNGTDLQVGEVANLYVDTSTSRVGIGTGSPHTLFHTHSDAGADETWVDQWKHSLDANWNFRLSQRHDIGNSVEYGIKQRYNQTEYSPITFRGPTMELGGNVGIGTSSPQEKFHLYGSPMIQHGTRYDVGASVGWYKIGTWDAASATGARLKISLLGSESYSSQQSARGGETIIYASINNNIPTNVSNMSGSIHAHGNPVITQAKFKQVGTDRTQYEIIAYVETYTQHTMKIECSETTTFTRAWTSASDPGADSTTVQAALFTHVVDNAGNVGIGTTNPLSTLQVGDDSSSTTGDAPGSISIAGTGATKSNGNKPGLYHRANVGLGVWSDAKMSFEVNGYNGNQIEAMRILTSGDVGIGTATPYNSLYVYRVNADASIGIFTPNGQNAYLQMETFSARWKLQNDGSNGDLQFWNNHYGTKFTMDLTGNVGIGTTDPGAQLHIGPKNNNHLYLASSNNSYGWKIDTTDNGSGDVPLHISQRYGGTDTAVLVIKQGGNVGIGTTGPGAPLEIVSTRNCESWSKGNSIFNILYDNGSGQYYGMSFGVSAPYGDGVIQTYNVSNNAAQHDLRLQPNGGWVAIGTTQPTELLHVAARSTSDSAFIRIQAGSGGSPATQSGIKLTESGNYGFQFVHEADTDLLKVKHQDSNGNVDQDNIMVWHPNGDVHLGKASKKNFHYNPNTWSYATQATTGNFWSVSYYFDHEGYVFVSTYGHWARKDSNNTNHVGGNEGVYIWVSVDNKTVADSGLYDSFSGGTANFNKFHEYWSPSSDGAGWWRDCSHSAFYKISSGWHSFSLRVAHGFTNSHYLNINGSGLNVFYIPKHYI